jgi:hypothetical protein
MPTPTYRPDVTPRERVHTSSRLWSQEVAMADAFDAFDAPGAGAAGLDKLVDERRSVAYEFGNGRNFVAPKNPYA